MICYKKIGLPYLPIFINHCISPFGENAYVLLLAHFLQWNLIFSSSGFSKCIHSFVFVCLYFYINTFVYICGANSSPIYHKGFNLVNTICLFVCLVNMGF